MPRIILPDGNEKNFDEPVAALTIAQSISPRLAKVSVAALVNDKLVDMTYLIDHDASLKIITKDDPAALEVIRHSAAHLLAQAVKQLYPSAQVTIGPVIEDGFFYDFAFERPFTPEDLAAIEARMQELVKADLPIARQVLSRDEAIKLFKGMGEHYKVKIIEDIPGTETLTAYQQGDFIDLCRGPHVPRTGFLGAVKLTKLAGAYWRGDSRNEVLQRVYGTAWNDSKALQAYLDRIAEAEKRDHRVMAKKMDLFHVQEEAPGMIFWHPNGWTLYQAIEQYMRKMMRSHGYEEVRTPQIVDISLWEKSGHKEKFSDDMFMLEIDKDQYAVKPMNCPCHVQIFKQGIQSYRDLPLRLSEFGCCHRNEGSGALHGLFRTRCFTQDDAHIFCTEEQIQSEVHQFIDLLFKVYAQFGFNADDVLVKLSTRPEKRVGSEETWDKAEKALENTLNAKGLAWQLMPGEGAFYGPKIEFVLKDCLGRLWTTGSIQLDFSMPMRLEAEYVAEDGSRKVPVMLHRAICGSLERFMGVLLEHYAGWVPVWLAPIQVMVMNITDKQADYVQEIVETLKNLGVRAKSDLRNEKIGFKIREHVIARVPYQVVVGDREVADRMITLRSRDSKETESMPLDAFIQRMAQESKAS